MITRCVTITESSAVVDNKVYAALGNEVAEIAHLDDIGRFLARMAEMFTAPNHQPGNGAGSVLLARGVHTRLGLPAELPADEITDHPVLNTARAAGWHISGITPWMTFWRRDRPTVHVAVLDWLSPRSFPLLDPASLVVTTGRCAAFHNSISAPFHGSTAGLAGIAALKDNWRPTSKYREPFWRPRNWESVEPVQHVAEQSNAWTSTFMAGKAQPEWELGYDVTTQYLMAAGVATFALAPLSHRPVSPGKEATTATFGNLPGYYLTYVSEWPWAGDIPHPIGDHHPVGQQVWITAPTLDLLVKIATEDPTFAYPVVVDRWIAPAGARVMRGWSERIRDAIDTARDLGDPVLLQAVKDTYKSARGMLERPTSRIYRPDWSHTIVAQARCNLWRKVWAEGTRQWPTAISADTVWYAAYDDDHLRHWPSNFPDNRFHAYGAHHRDDPLRCWTDSGVACPRCRQLGRGVR